MKYLSLLLDITVHHNIISFFLSFSEYDGPAMFATIHQHHISNNLSPLMKWTIDC